MNTRPMIMVAPDRVLHVCVLGSRLDYRTIGAYVIYVGLREEITVCWDDGTCTRSRLVSVPPYRRHRISAGRQYVKTILIEPETVTERAVTDLRHRLDNITAEDARNSSLFQPESLERLFRQDSAGPVSKQEFDRINFGYELEHRDLDERVVFATTLMRECIGDAIHTGDCAEEFAISSSRFRRLFVGDTGVQFRKYRMWRRARAYLEKVVSRSSLTDIALDLGYPDSTHFSRSIRSTYGLPPREMKRRMQNSVFVLPGGEIAPLRV